MSLEIRPSQFITTYGPGAIIETPFGPHVLCSTKDALNWISFSGIHMSDLAIRDIRLQLGLLKGQRIFKIPDVQNKIWKGFNYPTRKFPTWNLCVKHHIVHKAIEGCPECKTSEKNESKSNKYAIRFLRACPAGHMDDVDWTWQVHQRKFGQTGGQPCKGGYFHWSGAASSLNSIKIICGVKNCGASATLGDIYSSETKCWGRRPENLKDIENASCDKKMRVFQRGSFGLRLPELVTSLTIPPLVSEVHKSLQREDVLDFVKTLKSLDSFTEEKFWKILNEKIIDKRIPEFVQEQLKRTSWAEIEQSIEQIEKSAEPTSLSEYLCQEHKALIEVIETGFPPYPHDNERRPGEPISFQVEATAIRPDVKSPLKKFIFRIMPLDRLRVVLVQVGFYRVEYKGKDSQPSSNSGILDTNPQEKWLPGVEQYGEGIYIDLNPNIMGQKNWYPSGTSATIWDKTITSTPNTNDLVLWNALSVWWHTFSHRLINAMAIHSGYNSSSIRERLYLTKTSEGDLRGGILLYTTQPGGDGTLGGLTSLVPEFENILSLALDNIDRCSNDPLCEHAEIDKVSKLGAACYSCEMVSETSCEHFNGYLHRGLLLDEVNRP